MRLGPLSRGLQKCPTSSLTTTNCLDYPGLHFESRTSHLHLLPLRPRTCPAGHPSRTGRCRSGPTCHKRRAPGTPGPDHRCGTCPGTRTSPGPPPPIAIAPQRQFISDSSMPSVLNHEVVRIHVHDPADEPNHNRRPRHDVAAARSDGHKTTKAAAAPTRTTVRLSTQAGYYVWSQRT